MMVITIIIFHDFLFILCMYLHHFLFSFYTKYGKKFIKITFYLISLESKNDVTSHDSLSADHDILLCFQLTYYDHSNHTFYLL